MNYCLWPIRDFRREFRRQWLRTKRRSIFKRIQPIERAGNQHSDSIQRQADRKRAERNGVIRVAAEYLSQHVPRFRNKLNAKSVANDIRGYLCSKFGFDEGHTVRSFR